MNERLKKCINNKQFIGQDLLLELEEYLIVETDFTLDEINNIYIAINHYNNQLYNQMIRDNKKMQELLNNRPNEIMKIEVIQEEKPIKKQSTKQEDLSIDLDISFYLELLKSSNTYEDIVDVLPDKKTDNYQDIINSILVYYYGELLTIISMLKEETDEELFKAKESCENKISLIKKYRNDLNNPKIKLTKKGTKLVFLRTINDNVCILSDIERDIEPEFYSDIKELLVSLKNGIFKNVKAFNDNRDLNGLSEVRYRKARITFKRLTNNTCIILHGFIKKWYTNSHYRNFLKDRYSLYKNQSVEIDEQIMTDDYIENNNKIYRKIIEILNKEKRGEGSAKIKRYDQ